MFSGLTSRCTTPVPVGVVQRLRHLAREPDGVLDRELHFAPQPVAEALALDVGHRVPELPVRLAGVVNREDVRVLEPGRRSDLAQEALGTERRGELRVQDLERHAPVVPEIVR